MAENIPVFPIAGWDVGRAEAGTVLLRFLYLATPQELPQDAQQGLMHAFSPDQATELPQALRQFGSDIAAR